MDDNRFLEQLSDDVDKCKEDFLMEVGRLNYVVKILKESPEAFTDSSLTSAVRGVVKTYEDYINSKIQFTEKYFKEKYKNETNR